MFHFMRLGLTTEGAETPVRAARKEACERIRFAQLGRNSPTLDGRQMICGRGVDEWHEVRLPPSSFRAPRSGFPRFQWLTDLSTAPPLYQVRPFARPGHRQLGPLGTNGPYTFCLHPNKSTCRHNRKESNDNPPGKTPIFPGSALKTETVHTSRSTMSSTDS